MNTRERNSSAFRAIAGMARKLFKDGELVCEETTANRASGDLSIETYLVISARQRPASFWKRLGDSISTSPQTGRVIWRLVSPVTNTRDGVELTLETYDVDHQQQTEELARFITSVTYLAVTILPKPGPIKREQLPRGICFSIY